MAKQQSLAAQSGALSVGNFELPAVFSAPQDAIKSRSIAPYVTFAHPKRADEWNRLVGQFKSVAEGEMYLVRPETLHKLDVLKCGWLCHKQYWAETNPAGDVLAVSFEERPKPFKEHVEAVVLVYLDEEIVPANVQFRTTKCPAAKAMSDALAKASSPEWGDLGPQHKETLVVNQPFFRFYGKITLGPQRTSKSSGLTYRPTQCTIEPTAIPEWRLIKAFTESADCKKSMDAAAERYSWRINEAKSKVRATAA